MNYTTFHSRLHVELRTLRMLVPCYPCSGLWQVGWSMQRPGAAVPQPTNHSSSKVRVRHCEPWSLPPASERWLRELSWGRSRL